MGPPHDLITSQRPDLLIPSHWGLGFQHGNLGDTWRRRARIHTTSPALWLNSDGLAPKQILSLSLSVLGDAMPLAETVTFFYLERITFTERLRKRPHERTHIYYLDSPNFKVCNSLFIFHSVYLYLFLLNYLKVHYRHDTLSLNPSVSLKNEDDSYITTLMLLSSRTAK